MSLGITVLSVSPIVSAAEISPISQSPTPKIEMEKDTSRWADMEEENNLIYQSKLKVFDEAVKAQMETDGINSFKEFDEKEQQEIRQLEYQMFAEARMEIDKNMEKYGWKRVSQSDDEEEKNGLMSKSTDLILADDLYYHEHLGQWQFVGTWNWVNFTWDTYANTLDIAAFRALYQPRSIDESYSYTYAENGYQTNNISKRYEDLNGVAFNVEDELIETPGGIRHYNTDSGRISVYFKSSGYNKFFLDYEHNWKTYYLSASATINFVDIKSTALTVSYNGTPNTFLRSSEGEKKN